MDYFNLGTYHRPISTKNKNCQTWFNRGLLWTYGFNHEEGATCFDKASKEDPECIMALWGLAFALGPNYNKPWEMFDPKEMEHNLKTSREAVKRAKEIANDNNSTEVERALINAMQWRYQDSTKDKSTWNADYSKAMEEVYQQFGGDLDVAALYGGALMDLSPWALWDLQTGEPAKGARTLEAKAVLDRAVKQEGGMEHPGLLHLYIHMIEMSLRPEDGLFAADALRGLVPDAGHLQHMPSHLDVLCGDYRAVVSSNAAAIRADERWVALRPELNFYTLYRVHDYHFRVYGAMFTAQSAIALSTCKDLEATIPDEILRMKSPPMADWLESFIPLRLHVLIRFGRWEDILQLDLPEDQELYSVTTAFLHYAKGISHANLHNLSEARKEHDLFLAAQGRVQDTRTQFNNTCKDVLKIAASMLAGELAYHSGQIEEAFSNLKIATHQSDNLKYEEPWGWMQPPRHAYGALLLDQDRVEEAKAIYIADLGLDDTLARATQHPNNVWSLHGYHECLVRTKGAEDSETRFVKKLLDIAAASADVEIGGSCYCRSSRKEVKGEVFQVKPWRFNGTGKDDAKL